MKKSWSWLKSLSILQKFLVGLGVVVLLGAVGANNQQQTEKNLNTQPTSSHTQEHSPVITTKTVIETESIPYTSTTIENSNLAKGTTNITTQGVNGVRTNTYKITYEDGKQKSKELISSSVTTAPVNQVTTVGTYVAPAAPSCPNGTYVNSAGNEVCSPYSSPSTPAGATAKCVDGTFSFSQARSGTCSHHGGVAEWL